MLSCKTDGWAETLGGVASPGRRWRLIFTTGQLLHKSIVADWLCVIEWLIIIMNVKLIKQYCFVLHQLVQQQPCQMQC